MEHKTIDRFRGCIYGQAIGDALGLGTEFMTDVDIAWKYPHGLQHYKQIYQDRHRKRWKIGDWTDDTDMMLCIADSIIEDKGVNFYNIARHFKGWADGVPMGIGKNTYKVLMIGDYVEHPFEVSYKVCLYKINNMALAININDLLNKQKIESNRIEFKKGWNPGSIYHSICAFANDFDDLGGGYIIVGVDTDDKTGMAIRPVEGVPLEKIDGILQEMVAYNNKMAPYYLPRTSVEEVDGKQVVVIWCPAGSYRPYSVPVNVTAKGSKEYFYIRSGTSSIEARGEALVELRELANRMPFDERGNSDIQLEDISLVLLRDYLVKVGSKLVDEVITTPLATILDQMELYTGPKENRLLRNVAAMMFCENPNKFFPYTQIDVVTFPNGKMKDPNNFTEVTFKGSVPQIIKQTMDYIKSNVLKEHVRKVSGRQEAERYWNYPYDAIEEAVVNSVYHRDFLQHEPIEITIEPNGISILNCPGPDRSISKEDIEKGDMLKSRRYRNRRLGDFLKELDLTEDRSTGVPTIQAKLAENGSPRAFFETTDDRLTFLVTVPIHKGCEDCSGTQSKSSETGGLSSEKSIGGSEKSSEKTSNSSEKILELIKQNPKISAAGIAMQIGISSRGVEKQIKKLREAGIIKRNGADKGGYWEIVILDND